MECTADSPKWHMGVGTFSTACLFKNLEASPFTTQITNHIAISIKNICAYKTSLINQLVTLEGAAVVEVGTEPEAGRPHHDGIAVPPSWLTSPTSAEVKMKAALIQLYSKVCIFSVDLIYRNLL